MIYSRPIVVAVDLLKRSTWRKEVIIICCCCCCFVKSHISLQWYIFSDSRRIVKKSHGEFLNLFWEKMIESAWGPSVGVSPSFKDLPDPLLISSFYLNKFWIFEFVTKITYFLCWKNYPETIFISFLTLKTLFDWFSLDITMTIRYLGQLFPNECIRAKQKTSHQNINFWSKILLQGGENHIYSNVFDQKLTFWWEVFFFCSNALIWE